MEIFKIPLYRYVRYLVILAPGMSALCAPEKPHFTLIRCSELAEPPERQVVLAFRAFDLGGGHGFYLFLFIVNDHNLFFYPLPLNLHLIGIFYSPDIPAFPALQLTGRGHQHGFTFRTKHRFTMRDDTRLSPRMTALPDVHQRCHLYPNEVPYGFHPVATTNEGLVQNPFFGIRRISL